MKLYLLIALLFAFAAIPASAAPAQKHTVKLSQNYFVQFWYPKPLAQRQKNVNYNFQQMIAAEIKDLSGIGAMDRNLSVNAWYDDGPRHRMHRVMATPKLPVAHWETDKFIVPAPTRPSGWHTWHKVVIVVKYQNHFLTQGTTYTKYGPH